jgi:hypothetical protein
MASSSSARRSSSGSSRRSKSNPILVVSKTTFVSPGSGSNSQLVRSQRTGTIPQTRRKSTRSPPLVTIASKPRGASVRTRSLQSKITAVVKAGDSRYRAAPSTTGSVPITHIETVQTHRGPIPVRVKSPIVSYPIHVNPPTDPSVEGAIPKRDGSLAGISSQKRLPSTKDLSQQYSSHPDAYQVPVVRRRSDPRLGSTGRPSSSSNANPGLRHLGERASQLELHSARGRAGPPLLGERASQLELPGARGQKPEAFDISSMSDRSRTSRSNQAKAQQLAIELDIREQIAVANHSSELLQLRLAR